MGVRQPAGVVVGMAPWNAPVILATRAVATPLAYGNTVVLKASRAVPAHPRRDRARARRRRPAGRRGQPDHPRGRGRARRGRRADRPPGDAPRQLHGLHAGSAGSSAIKCAEHLKRCLLELGGKAPLVVLADADLEAAADAASFGAFMNSGPDLHVDRADRGRPRDRRRRSAPSSPSARGKLTVGDPRDQGHDDRPGRQRRRRASAMMELIEDARARAPRSLTGGEADGNLITPTVLASVTPEMRIYARGVLRPGGDDRPGRRPRRGGARRQRHRVRPLRGRVQRGRRRRRWTVARRIESGICHINSSTVHDEPQMPFGGVKASGWGRFGGQRRARGVHRAALDDVQEGARHYPI